MDAVTDATTTRGPRTPEEEARIAARYPARRRWTGWVLGALAVVLIGGWTLWAGLSQARPQIAGQVQSFEVTSDTDVRVVLRVDRADPSIPGVCTVITQAVNYQQVGEVEVQVPPGDTRLLDVPINVRTIARATSASLKGCRSA